MRPNTLSHILKSSMNTVLFVNGLQPVQIKLSFHFNYSFLKFTRMTVSNYYTN